MKTKLRDRNFYHIRRWMIAYLKARGHTFSNHSPSNRELACLYKGVEDGISKRQAKDILEGFRRSLGAPERAVLSKSIKERKLVQKEIQLQRQDYRDFYKSPAWRTLRFKVLLKYGRRCLCCGATPTDGKQLHVDHIIPRSIRPDLELEEENCQPLCDDCNLGKSNRDTTDFRVPILPKASKEPKLKAKYKLIKKVVSINQQ